MRSTGAAPLPGYVPSRRGVDHDVRVGVRAGEGFVVVPRSGAGDDHHLPRAQLPGSGLSRRGGAAAAQDDGFPPRAKEMPARRAMPAKARRVSVVGAEACRPDGGRWC